jgi:hypothetical protein
VTAAAAPFLVLAVTAATMTVTAAAAAPVRLMNEPRERHRGIDSFTNDRDANAKFVDTMGFIVFESGADEDLGAFERSDELVVALTIYGKEPRSFYVHSFDVDE